MISVKDKIVVITGASAGIGASCANFFGEAGAKLILAARRLENLDELAESLKEKYHTETYLIQLDVRDRPGVEAAFSHLPESWNNIEILINNAGLSRGLEKFHQASIEDWEEMIDTNVKGLLYVSRSIIPGMVDRGAGHIVNIGSIAGRAAYPGGHVYCASKACGAFLTA